MLVYTGFMALFPLADTTIVSNINDFLTSITSMTKGMDVLFPVDLCFWVIKSVLAIEASLLTLRIIAKVLSITTMGKVNLGLMVPGGRIDDAWKK